MSRFFGRQYRIEIGGRVLDSSQTTTPLQIRFSIETSFAAAQSMMELSIYNLTKDTINQFAQDQPIVFQAGYKGLMGIIFEGRVVNFHAPREGTDRVLRLYAWSGLRPAKQQLADVSFDGGTRYDQIVDHIAYQVFQKNPRYIGFDQEFRDGMGTAASGYSSQLPHRTLLDRLGHDLGFEWLAQNGAVLLFERGKYRPGEPVLINPNTGLVGGVSLTWLGADIETKLDPTLNIGDRVRIEAESTSVNFSKIYHLNLPKEKTTLGDGAYVIKTIRRQGDFYGQNGWTNSLVCWREGETGIERDE